MPRRPAPPPAGRRTLLRRRRSRGVALVGLSRRTVLTTALAGTAAGALALNERAATAASPPGDVVGKITVGYQGWFACTGDGAPINGWWHWSQNWSQPPSPSNNGSAPGPTCASTRTGTRPPTPNLGNGQPATLFSSYDQQTVDTHFRWMQQYGFDTAALQRFNPNGGEGPTRDAMAVKVRSAAEATRPQVLHHVRRQRLDEHAVGDQDRLDDQDVRAHRVDGVRRQNGKPVVCIWGFGFNDDNHPFAPAACLDVINWFKGQGCYVIGGVPRDWRTGDGGLAGRLLRRLPRLQHDLAVDGRRASAPSPTPTGSTRTSTSPTRPTATPTASTTSRACCPATSPPASGRTATSCGGSSTTWSASARRASTSRCSTSSTRATRSPRPPRPRRPCRPTPASSRSTRTAPPARPTTTCGSPATAAGCSRARSRSRHPADPADRRYAGQPAADRTREAANAPEPHDSTVGAGLERVDRQRRRRRLPRVQRRRVDQHAGRHDERARVHGDRAGPGHRLHLRRHRLRRGRQQSRPSRTRSRSPRPVRPTPTWRCTGRPPRAAIPRSTGRATPPTAIPTRTGRAPTTPSRSGSRSTSARRSATRRIVLTLPPPSAWGTRTQTLSVLGSTDGSNFSTVVGSAGYTVQPGHRQHGHDRLPGHDNDAVSAAQLHREHRLAGRAGLGVPGLRGLTPVRGRRPHV